ncbi:MAG: DegV family protein [Lachnospiraceae bacterium]|nr:DegV family protein [Lachnospiraceae bacterium]
MPVKIISDSTCDLSQEIIQRFDIEVFPLVVTLGDRVGKDGVDIEPDDIYAYVEKTGKLSKTSAINAAEYMSVFKKWRDQGYEVVHVNISSDFSSCYQNACIAAQEVGGVYVVDSRNLSSGQGHVVLYAADLAKEGLPAEEIAEKCRNLTSRVEASFVVNTIDYLYKGGRCSALAALGANLLGIKPCIEVIGGKMTPGKKYRGNINKVIRAYAEDRLKDRQDIVQDRIFITHTKCDPEVIEQVKALIKEFQPGIKEVFDTTAGATVTTHCGPGTLGVLFIRKE